MNLFSVQWFWNNWKININNKLFVFISSVKVRVPFRVIVFVDCIFFKHFSHGGRTPFFKNVIPLFRASSVPIFFYIYLPLFQGNFNICNISWQKYTVLKSGSTVNALGMLKALFNSFVFFEFCNDDTF